MHFKENLYKNFNIDQQMDYLEMIYLRIQVNYCTQAPDGSESLGWRLQTQIKWPSTDSSVNVGFRCMLRTTKLSGGGGRQL